MSILHEAEQNKLFMFSSNLTSVGWMSKLIVIAATLMHGLVTRKFSLNLVLNTKFQYPIPIYSSSCVWILQKEVAQFTCLSERHIGTQSGGMDQVIRT
jgi:hypothetical protein